MAALDVAIEEKSKSQPSVVGTMKAMKTMMQNSFETGCKAGKVGKAGMAGKAGKAGKASKASKAGKASKASKVGKGFLDGYW